MTENHHSVRDALNAAAGESEHADAGRTRVRAIFDVVSLLPTDEQQTAVREAQLSDADRRQLLSLLESHGKRRLFGISAAQWAEELETDDKSADSLIGKDIGPFHIVRFLGRGGSSVVFLGRRTIGDAEQEVAVKLLSNGVFSSEARRRFRREQMLLSRLTHPNIARLIDAGISEFGSPYIAMDYVEGIDLIAYAARHPLDLRGRIRLLIDTCRAVDAAHRSLIVHRDLKPSNVLVTADGVVKVLDFGIAKLVDDDGLETATHHIALTPAYAAPEQYQPGPVATSMDVFSLGVLASELLVGGRLGADATLPLIDTSDIKQRWRKLDGDLVQILRAALASEPRRRYSSAGHLADDFGRYLRREPIQIVPLSKSYRVRKFVSRHRGMVSAGALLAVAVVAGIVGVAYQASVAHQQADIARQQAALAREQLTRANEVRDFLVSVFKAAGEDYPRDQRPSVETIVENASHRLLTDNHLADTLRLDLLITLAEVESGIGAYERAETLLAQVDTLAASSGERGKDAAIKSRVIRAGMILAQTATSDGTIVLSLLEPVRHDLENGSGETAVHGLLYLAHGFEYTGRADEALAIARGAVARAQETRNPELLLSAMERRASLMCESGRHLDAISSFQDAMKFWEEQGRPDLPVTVGLFGGTAIAKEAVGDVEGAEAAYRQAIATADRFYERDNVTTATWLHHFGTFLIAQARADEAAPYLNRALQISQNLYGSDDTRILQSLATMSSLAAARGDYDEAIRWASKVIDLCIRHGVHGSALIGRLLERTRIEIMADRLSDAAKDVARATAERDTAAADDTGTATASIRYARLEIEVRRGDYEQAVKTADDVLAFTKVHGVRRRQVELLTRFYRAQALLGLHRNAEALAEISDIEPEYATAAPKSPHRFDIAVSKVRALKAANMHAEAKRAAQSAIGLASLKPGSDRDVMAYLRSTAQ